MLSCLNPIRPPIITTTRRPTIKNRRLTAMATRRSIQTGTFNGVKDGRRSAIRSSSGTITLAAGGCAIDEQAPLGNDLLAGLQIIRDLDQIAVNQAGLDLAQFDRLVLVHHPDPD